MKKKKKKKITLPVKFEPMFWEDSDGRCSIVRLIRDRYETLKDDCRADSYQKELLCQRAVFVSIQLESMEVRATQTGVFDAGVYATMTNTFLGLLKNLGLERKAKKVDSLESYIGKRKK